MPPNYSGGKNETLFTKANVTTDTYGPALTVAGYRGVLIVLDADFKSGTSTLDVKIQCSIDGVTWFDIPNAVFVQVTTSDSDQQLQIWPGITAVTNKAVNALIGNFIRAFMDVGAAGSPDYDVGLETYLVS